MMSHDFITTWWLILASNPTGEVAPKIHGRFAQGTIFLKDGGHLFKVQACAARASSRSRGKQAVYGDRMGQNGILTLCVNIYIYVNVCMYIETQIYTHVDIYIYIQNDAWIYIYIYICIYIYMCVCVSVYVHIYVAIYTNSHILIQIYMNTYRQIHVYNQLDIVCVCLTMMD